MPLPGQAALLLSFDVADEAIREHDDWHTHEHLPERLSIPGFMRGTRWVALRGEPRYFVLYEVEQINVLTSAPYQERLNNPSPWTSKMMPFYRDMSRGLCSIAASYGTGLGHACLLIRFKPESGKDQQLRDWLIDTALPGLPTRPGLGSAHLFETSVTPSMTREQRFRGADAVVFSVVLVTGYAQDALENLLAEDLGKSILEKNGATGILDAIYRMDYALIRDEVPVQ